MIIALICFIALLTIAFIWASNDVAHTRAINRLLNVSLAERDTYISTLNTRIAYLSNTLSREVSNANSERSLPKKIK